MRRRSERSKAKSAPKEESPEKTSRNSTGTRSSRRRKKSTSPEIESKSPVKDGEDLSQPLEIQVQDIELPEGDNPAAESNNDDKSKPSEVGKEWKEDTNFWQSESSQVCLSLSNCTEQGWFTLREKQFIYL